MRVVKHSHCTGPFCTVGLSLIDRTMCHGEAEYCSWKYIICNFSWVNIAGSLVNQRDKLFWERKCCLSFLIAGKEFSPTPGNDKVLSRVLNNGSTVAEGAVVDHVLECLSSTLLSQEVDVFFSDLNGKV